MAVRVERGLRRGVPEAALDDLHRGARSDEQARVVVPEIVRRGPGRQLRRCPDAVFLPSDRAAYDAASDRVMATLRSLPVVVEVWGWDEAFVGARTADPWRLTERLAS